MSVPPIDAPVTQMTMDDLKGVPRITQVLEKVFFQAMEGDLNAAKLYLSKVMPDMKSIDVNLKKPIEELEDSELRNILNAVRGVVTAQQAGNGSGEKGLATKAH